MQLIKTAVFLGCLLAMVTSDALATQWTGSIDTDWNTGGNWDTGTVPGIGVEADLRMTGSDYTINYESPMSAEEFGRLHIGNDGDYSTTLNINATGFVSYATNANLNVESNGAIVVGAGGVASFTSDSASGHHLIQGDMTVNDGGSLEVLAVPNGGNIYITSDSTVTLNDGTLRMEVRQTGSRFIVVSGGATININGGQAELLQQVRVGVYNEGDGTLNMTAGVLNLGGVLTRLGTANSRGIMNVSGGEVNNAGILQIGEDNYISDAGALNLSGGIWRQAGDRLVSVAKKRGMASLNVTGSGVFTTTGDTILGEGPDHSVSSVPDGTLLVDGGSYVATNAVGDATLTVRRGSLVLQGGGTVAVDVLRMGEEGAAASLAFSSGTLMSRATAVSNETVFVVGNGTDSATLDLCGGGHSFLDGLRISDHAVLRSTGAVTVGGAGTTVDAGGTLYADAGGAEDGSLVFDSDLTVGIGATLNHAFEMGTRSNAVIVVSGNLALPDSLTVDLEATGAADGFILTLFAYGSLAGVPDVTQWTRAGTPGYHVEHDPVNNRIVAVWPPSGTVVSIR